MARKQGKSIGNVPRGGNYYKRFLQAALLAWGYVPPEDAPLRDLRRLILRVLVQISQQQGIYNLDPELPDSYASLIMPALISRGIPKNDIAQVLNVASPVGGASGQGGSIANSVMVGADGTVGTVGEIAASGDNWRTNTAEWWSDLWSGDFASAWVNFQQGWNDFWAGNL